MSERPRATAAVLAFWWTALLAVGYLVGQILSDASWHWDWSVVQELRGTRGAPLLGVMRAVTALGSATVLDAVFAVAVLALLIARWQRDAVFLTLASPGSVLLGVILKQAVARARPAGAHLTPADGFSWPSEHAASSLALYGALLIILLRVRPLSRRWMTYGAAGAVTLLVGVIGLSRVYLGVHYPTDVVASWLLVGAWLLVTRRVLYARPTGGSSPTRAPATERPRPAASR